MIGLSPTIAASLRTFRQRATVKAATYDSDIALANAADQLSDWESGTPPFSFERILRAIALEADRAHKRRDDADHTALIELHNALAREVD